MNAASGGWETLLTLIGRRTFYGCTALVSIVLMDMIASIEYGAFSGYRRLMSIDLPAVHTQ
jgi:hypothetical protein